MRVLIVEDEPALSRQLSHALGDAGYVTDAATDGERAGLPGANRTVRRHRARPRPAARRRPDAARGVARVRACTTPVLVLTARGSWHEKVQGIDSGADDYVAKPFRIEEVLARLRALIRRASGHAQPRLRCGAVTLDPRIVRVTLDGRSR